MRKPAPAPERLVRLAEVLAELDGADPRDLVGEAERLAQDLTPRIPVTRDWASKPCVSWQDAERLLLSIWRDRELAALERSAAVAAQDTPTVLAGFVVGLERPGQAPVYSPALAGRDGDPGLMELPG